MKNFLELLATKPGIVLKMQISAISENGDPNCWIRINNELFYDDVLTNPIHIERLYPLTQPLRVEVGMRNKKYSAEKETAVLISSLNIDGFEIVPNWTHLATYTNERNNELPTAYLGFNGTWVLDIPVPFYQWHHQVQGHGWLLQPIIGYKSSVV